MSLKYLLIYRFPLLFLSFPYILSDGAFIPSGLVSHSLSVAGCRLRVQLLFLCPLYVLQIGSWIQRLDRTQVQSHW